MRIAIEVAGFTPGRVGRLPAGDGDVALEPRDGEAPPAVRRRLPAPARDDRRAMAEELFRQVAAFASFGFAKSHAAAFARTAYESSFLKLFYPAQFLVGLDQRPADGLLPGGGARQRREAPRRGRPAGGRQRVGLQDDDRMGGPGRRAGPGRAAAATAPGSRPGPSRSARRPASIPVRRRRASAGRRRSRAGWGVRLGLHLVKGIGEQHEAPPGRGAGARPVPRRSPTSWSGPGSPEEVLERLIRTGALDSLGRPRRELLWQLREVAAPVRQGGAAGGAGSGPRSPGGRWTCGCRRPTAPDLPPLTELERLGDAYAVIGARRAAPGGHAVPAGAGPAGGGDQRGAGGAAAGAGPDRWAGRDPAAPDDGARARSSWRSRTRPGWSTSRSGRTPGRGCAASSGGTRCCSWTGTLQRESNVVNVVAREVRPLVDEARRVGGPERPDGVRQLGYAGMRRSG